MRKAIIKFKHWLIHKLGGYLRFEVIQQPIHICKEQTRNIVFEKTITRKEFEMMENDCFLQQELIREYVNGICTQITQLRLCDFAISEVPIMDGVRLRMTTRVIVPENSATIFEAASDFLNTLKAGD